MAVVSMKALLESGVHFGHRTHKWDPGMKPYIFTERNGIHIIDLQKTAKSVEQAYTLVRNTVSEGGNVLFVGTKRQAQETVQNEAVRAGMPYVTMRWLGGMLTNWRTIRARINELERLERMRDSGDFGRITKKEALILTRVIERLETLLGGIRNMIRVPELLFVVDVHREATAIHEANILKIPVIAMVTPTAIPAMSISSSPPTMTPSAPSSWWSARSLTPLSKGAPPARKRNPSSPRPWKPRAQLAKSVR
jgi:small subunit ribosomal protein S2